MLPLDTPMDVNETVPTSTDQTTVKRKHVFHSVLRVEVYSQYDE